MQLGMLQGWQDKAGLTPYPMIQEMHARLLAHFRQLVSMQDTHDPLIKSPYRSRHYRQG